MVKEYIAVNEKGCRVGQDHQFARLTDIEVLALIQDRGPDDAPLMSYTQLSKKYGISKSSVRDILIGRRRGQAQRLVKKDVVKREYIRKEAKVRVNLRVSLRSRAILHRLGGGAWIDMLAVRVDDIMRRARSLDDAQAVERVLANIGVTR